MKEVNISTANESYINQIQEIEKELKKLTHNIKNHKSKQKLEPNNWGYSGDIGYILGQIKECNQFLTNQ